MLPFAGSLTTTANASLLFVVATAFFYALLIEQPVSWRRSVVKTLPILLLTFLAYDRGGPLLLVAGLLFSAAGDAFLSRDGERAFLAGLASFLIGHCLYIALFVGEGDGLLLFASEPWRIAGGLFFAVFALFMAVRLAPVIEPALRAPVLAYIATILAMALASLSLGSLMVVTGAVAFMVSDALLAMGRFVLAPNDIRQRLISLALWVLYVLAQILITLGFLL